MRPPVIDLQPLVTEIVRTVARHNLGEPGRYCRWLWQDKKGKRWVGLDPYGCADALNLLYTINHFPRDSDERAAFVRALREFQCSDTGLWEEGTHHPLHTTAHCIAALELLDARPAHRLRALEPLHKREGLEHFLDTLDWTAQPWSASHQGAGVYAALVLAGEVPPEWEDWYFAWLWEEADPETGYWRRGGQGPEAAPAFHHLAGSFHYLFNHEYARRPLRHPGLVVDSCLLLAHPAPLPGFGRSVGFAEIDWVYCLTRSLQQCGRRWRECRQALLDFAEDYTAYLLGLDFARDEGWNDLHCLFGAACCLAELQRVLPGVLRTDRPLRLVLDRRPFI